MKSSDKVLTYEQARELKWFTKNCTGLRTEFYNLHDEHLKLKQKLDRLEYTAALIESYFQAHPELDPDKLWQQKGIE